MLNFAFDLIDNNGNFIPNYIGDTSDWNPVLFLLKNDYNNRIKYINFELLDKLHSNKNKYIYPFLVKSSVDIKNICNFKINDKLLLDLICGNSKIVFFHILEGFLDVIDLENIKNFIITNKIPQKSVCVVTSNNKLELFEKYTNIISIISIDYFLMNPWFINFDIDEHLHSEILRNRVNKILEYKKKYVPIKKFLSFNRIPRFHRIAFFIEIFKNYNLKNSFIFSIGSGENKNWKNIYDSLIDNDYKFNKNDGLEFIENFDISNGIVYDSTHEYNLAFNYNESIQINTWINVVTETLYDNNSIFLSEKIFKPIYSLQPFILIGNPKTLEYLKSLGFKTFSNFWDESYDLETNFSKRLEMIIELLLNLNNTSNEEILNINKEMQYILLHNYNHFIQMSNNEFFKLNAILHEKLSK